ncbi:MAG: DUF1294 domain-containing protein [Nitrososphaerota archaeon]|nr:DUF1294 domain-containing protein [Nitrososphaerota archaeon]MDG7026300.1 DUF1294 domain-containing protein [Nitrososphaerota archaeon]
MLGCLQSDLLYEAIGFVAMGIDKARAVGGEWRIPEATFLRISLVGGSLGVATACRLHRFPKRLLSTLRSRDPGSIRGSLEELQSSRIELRQEPR